MNIGKLNKRIRIFRQSTKTDAETMTDEPKRTEVRTVWANISPRTGSMLQGRDAGTMLSQTTHAITIRSRGDVRDDDYIIWTDEFGVDHRFDIDYILPPAGNRFMTIYAKEAKP